MLDEVDAELERWCGTIAPRVDVRLGLPSVTTSPRRTIWLHLAGFLPASHGGVARRLNLELALGYVVTATATDARAGHKLLGALLRAAMEHPSYEVALDAVESALWLSHGCPQLPAFRLAVPWTWERAADPVPYVQETTLERVPLRDLAGTLVGPGDTPMPYEPIRIPRLKAVAETDSAGSFRFTAIPADPARELELTIRHRSFRLKPGPTPATIRFNP